MTTDLQEENGLMSSVQRITYVQKDLSREDLRMISLRRRRKNLK